MTAPSSTTSTVRTIERCPGCGAPGVLAVRVGACVNAVCAQCGSCWHRDDVGVHQVDPATCPGCALEELCSAPAGSVLLGHGLLPYAADVRIETWGPSRERALDEAVSAFTHTFAATAPAAPSRFIECRVRAATDEELLHEVLEDALYLVDATGFVPVSSTTRGHGREVVVNFRCVDVSDVTPVGPLPRRILSEGVSCAPSAGGWRCAATLGR